MNISLVIPVYNDRKRIEPTLKKCTKYLGKKFGRYEIIVVDDGSSDNTEKAVPEYLSKNVRILRNKKNRGKGYSVKRGILSAKYPLVMFSDSDLATPIEELEKMLKYIRDYDVVIASRNMKESDVRTKQPFYRHIMGKVFPKLVSILVLRGIKDTQCGFKLFKTDKAKKIVSLQTFDRFSFDVEILLIAKKLGYKIKEVPVVWIDKKGSTVHPFKDSIRMLIDLFRIKSNCFFGKYKTKPGK